MWQQCFKVIFYWYHYLQFNENGKINLTNSSFRSRNLVISSSLVSSFTDDTWFMIYDYDLSIPFPAVGCRKTGKGYWVRWVMLIRLFHVPTLFFWDGSNQCYQHLQLSNVIKNDVMMCLSPLLLAIAMTIKRGVSTILQSLKMKTTSFTLSFFYYSKCVGVKTM